MASLKDLRELMKKAKSEYKNNPQKNEKYYLIVAYSIMGIYAVVALSVFIMPKDILERHEILLKFTEFMAGYFPNISVFSNASSLPQVVAFYTAIMWVVGIILFLFFFINCLIQLKDNSPVFIKNSIFNLFLTCFLGFFAFYLYFTGDVSTSRFSIYTSSRFKIFFMISFFQTVVSFFTLCSIDAVISCVYKVIYKIKRS